LAVGCFAFLTNRTSTGVPLPDGAANPGSVGDDAFSPLVKIVEAGDYVSNAPNVAFDVVADKLDDF
jgi:hypothetical protein